MDAKVLLIFVFLGFGLVPSHSQAPLVNREYHFVHLLMNWTSAQHYCREKYNDLATFESMDDIHRVNRPSQYQFAFIGLTDDPQSWKGIMGNDANSWRWSSTGETSKSGYHNWRTGQPNHYGTPETCVYGNAEGRWIDEACHLKLYFVCYDDTLPPGQKTYTLYNNQTRTWKDAQTYCRAHHTDLAVIENALENTDMLSIKSTQAAWIGLYRVIWRWSDNSNSSFRNWAYLQPNNYLGNQYCGAEDKYQKWHDVPCHMECPFWCQVVKVEIMVLRVKIHTNADLSDPATNPQILQQLRTVLRNKIFLTNFKLRWKIQPANAGADTDAVNG
ncbi:macrophage mannose receptor 1-like [Eleginops maclovinus]|uniref:macrophage mannose receptor 1-like n=1 Tax=Eleginops maclovinus TaxID=56733 RepID=UPI003080632E